MVARIGRASPLQSTVETEFLEAGKKLPLIVRPRFDEVSLVSWAGENLDWIESKLLEVGALLFRGFDMDTVDAFDDFIGTITPQRVNYIEGSSPRIMISDKIYTSTEYPPEYFVSMHNELSYAHRWPSKIFFYCSVAPEQGGETPIADSREVLERIDPQIRERFIKRQVKYMRNLHGGHGAGLAWQTVFETDDKKTIEDYCREGNIEFEWTENGGLRTQQVRPAVVTHPKTHEEVWFNQADQWHPTNLGKELAEALLMTTAEEDLPIHATFADGTPLEADELDAIREAFRDAMVVYPWEAGDILVADNTMVAHGRMPFSGPRKILVAMGGDAVTLDDVGTPRP